MKQKKSAIVMRHGHFLYYLTYNKTYNHTTILLLFNDVSRVVSK